MLPPFQCFLSYSNWSAIIKYSLVFGWLIMRTSYYKTTPRWVYSRLPWLLSYTITCLWIALSFKTLFITSNYCELLESFIPIHFFLFTTSRVMVMNLKPWSHLGAKHKIWCRLFDHFNMRLSTAHDGTISFLLVPTICAVCYFVI